MLLRGSSNFTTLRLNLLTILFRTTTPNITTLGLVDSDLKLLPQFVSYAHQHVKSIRSSSYFVLKCFQNVVPMLSIGGFTGSRWFSSHIRTPSNRTRFVKTVTDVVQRYNLDGLDFE